MHGGFLRTASVATVKKMDHYRKPIQSALQENLQHLQMDDSFDVLNFYKIMGLYRNHYKYH